MVNIFEIDYAKQFIIYGFDEFAVQEQLDNAMHIKITNYLQ